MFKGVLASLALCLVSVTATAQAPVEHFARLPATQGLSISPDGQRIAFISHVGNNSILVVENLDTGEQQGASADDLRVLGTFWADNNTVLARASAVINNTYVRGDVDRVAFISFNANTLQSRQLVEQRDLGGVNFDSARLAGRDPSTGDLLIALRDERARLNLVAVDPASGAQSRTNARGGQLTVAWVADPLAERFVQVRYSRRANEFTVRVQDNQGERTIFQQETSLIPLTVQGFTEDGDILISTNSTEPPFTRQLQRMDAQTGALGDVIFADDRYDFSSVRMDRHRGHIAGVIIERENPETIWFDEDLAEKQAALERVFEGSTVTLVDWSENRERFIVQTTTPAQPPIFFLMDFGISHAEAIKLAYPELIETPLAERTPITYTARDGTTIPAYMAVPEGEGPHPFVVLVHGGPAARDTGGFDYFAHFLADRGYGVIQPQYRGSYGFGRPWEAAGWGGWGTGVMQDDVSDAVTFLQEEGLADKICIVGGSYGGYSALAGATFTPNLYDCAISINGVSDLPEFLDYANDRFGTDSRVTRYWNLSISGESVEGVSDQALNRISPSQHTDNVSIPVLLLHGQDDTVVPVQQSRLVEQGLNAAGADVRFVLLRGGDHSLYEYDTRVQVLRQLELFLATHLDD